MIRCPVCGHVFKGWNRWFLRNKHMREEHGREER